MNKLIPLVVTAITIPTLTGCNQKIKRNSYLEVFEESFASQESDYHFENEYGFNTWLYDYDATVVNRLKELDAKKKYTEPTNMDKLFVYNIYRHGKGDYYLNSQIKFYDNGSIIVNDYGSNIADSYSYFTISQDDATKVFNYAQNRFEYAEQVKNEDIKTTKNEKGIDAFIAALGNKEKIPAVIKDKSQNIEFNDDGRLLNTLKNIEYTYINTSNDSSIRDNYYNAYYYNIANPFDYEHDSWYFALARHYTELHIINYMRFDRAGRQYVTYVNTYSISKEAGIAIVNEMRNIASNIQ